MSKGKRYTEEQIIKVLREIDAGASIASVARAPGITDQTLYRWREKYAGMSKSELVVLKALQEENRRLRHIVSELSLDLASLPSVEKLGTAFRKELDYLVSKGYRFDASGTRMIKVGGI